MSFVDGNTNYLTCPMKKPRRVVASCIWKAHCIPGLGLLLLQNGVSATRFGCRSYLPSGAAEL